MNTFQVLRLIRDALGSTSEVERVETVAQHEARQRREYDESVKEAEEFGDRPHIAPWGRSKRSAIPEDVLWVTLQDGALFFIKVTMYSGPVSDDPHEEGDPPWKKPKKPE